MPLFLSFILFSIPTMSLLYCSLLLILQSDPLHFLVGLPIILTLLVPLFFIIIGY